ncbi:aldehyde dehydrogenase [Mangrovicoccus ximenensis]|uniref:aldehyde dehydrogenase n=1 Tax=Mangrovicoccus ximenensis TaxID=1911570 RepID=UPI000D377B89|nr:aldehyde dehydrogenase [Mangrovicoccus ximenensis]
MRDYGHWIDGAEQVPEGTGWIEAMDPFRGTAWARIPRGRPEDAGRAVAAAKRAMTTGPWATMSQTGRGKILRRIGDLVLEHSARLAEIEVRDNGKLIGDVRGALQFKSDIWTYYAGYADKIEGAVIPIDKPDTLALTFPGPVGVVAAITAWNSPLQFLAVKCAPALAAGCAVVVKPSEHSSVSSLEFAAITREAGLPDGVLNVVTGFGQDVGPALVESPDVALVTFTGSDATGARIYQQAARGMKRVAMELGGKSPNIIFEDADLEAAAAGAISGIFGATGQMCTAGSRLLVQNSVKEQVTRRLLEMARTIKIGDPMDPGTQMGPVSNKPQFDKVMDYIGIAREDGAELAFGGRAAEGPGLTGGQFVEPTIFTGVENGMRIAQEEVFGPILSVIGFEDEADAIRIANDIDFGLAAGVWTKDMARLIRMCKAVEAGTVWANTYRTYSFMVPFGGRKRSGIGKEWGIEGIRDFIETKSVMISTATAAPSFIPR